MRRPFVTLFTAFTFIVLAVTGVLAFLRTFSIKIVGLHALMGFVFIGIVAFHVVNNIKPLKFALATLQSAQRCNSTIRSILERKCGVGFIVFA